MDSKYFFLFDEKRFNLYNTTYQNDDYFNTNVIKERHDILLDNFEDIQINQALKLKKSYTKYSYSTLKREALLN